MKNFLNNIIALIVFIVVAGILYTHFGAEWSTLYRRLFPCQSPIVYNLGTFDTKFGIPKSEFLSDIAEAEKVWEKALGKDLFKYDATATSSSTVKVNLIYDYRQEATVKIKKLTNAASGTKAQYAELKSQYEGLQKKYLADKAEYEEMVDNFDHSEKQLDKIRVMEAKLNEEVDEINALVADINALAQTLNINSATLNNIGQARGEEFTEGEYKENASEKEIDIYEYSNKAKLVRVLAHELGHALGLDHVSDPKAIMYYLNQSSNSVPTERDIEALKKVCKIS
ncbi:matrixin family metalloprotease [Patescibacteria group bacterium]|nr:matrixin family metalloprotease [Patescibacteria group bacterium]